MAHVTMSARTPDEACELAGRVFHAHRLEPRVSGGFAFSMTSDTVGPITVGELRYGSGVAIRTAEYRTAYQVNQAVEGTLRTSSGSERSEISERRAAVYRPDRPTVIAGWERPATMLAVKIQRTPLEQFVDSFMGEPRGGDPLPFVMSLDTTTVAGRAWRDSLRRLRSAARAGIAESAVLRSVLVDDCFTALTRAALRGPGETGGSAQAPAAGRSAYSRALELIHAAAAEPLTLPLLAAYAGVSGRALQLAFQQHLHTTPMRYLRQVRLDRARRELRRGDEGDGVGEVARRAGFGHTGRFAAEYAVRFGESPSETLRRGRLAAP
ncbi:AraC family transcriptional regulator [Cnuibacter sp. UC19_7]|uniref:helix-turn-helix transcriptional regulator n=1 Tax=Cnuibacter sp. UC19_7 TaxID=3350166 RepID=UPI00366B8737